MIKVQIFLLLFFPFLLNAKVIISPIEAMKQNYPNSEIIQQKLLLTNAQITTIEQSSKTKIKDKTFKIFKALKSSKNIGYGILIDRKVRSKNSVALYIISNDSILKNIEIIAFNEPQEYLPSKKWILQFNDTKSEKVDELSKNIPVVTGATLSAKSVIEGSRIAFAIYNELLKR